MTTKIPVLTRIWLLFVSLPVTYALLVLLMLPVRDWFKTLPEFTFPVVFLIGLIAVDTLLTNFFGTPTLNTRRRIALFIVFVVALLVSVVLGSGGPALQN